MKVRITPTYEEWIDERRSISNGEVSKQWIDLYLKKNGFGKHKKDWWEKYEDKP